MQVKVFTAIGSSQIQGLESTINQWLGSLPNTVEVKHTNIAGTAMGATGMGTATGQGMQPYVVVTVWYG
jgi:hypothetical protein